MVDEAAEVAPVGPADDFVHLHTHTEYSLLDGAARIRDLVATARRNHQPALAVTDHGALYGAVEFYAAARAAGIRPILGCEMYMAPRSRLDKEGRADRDPHHLILLARNQTGWRNLIQLVSRSHLEGYYYKPRIDKALLAEHAEGLICLSACIGGELPQTILSGNLDAAESVARQHLEMFGSDNYFLEMQDHGIPEEETIRTGLAEISRRTGVPLVATNDSHYIGTDDAEAHDILLCIQTQARLADEKRFRFHGPHFHLAGGDEMRQRFAAFGEAVRNSLGVAERCSVELPLGANLLPSYSPIPPGHTAATYLRQLCEAGLVDRYGDSPPAEARRRLEMELEVIGETGFAPYFLIVWDLIRAARCDGVVVGPGRGSSAGSLVAYVLRITNICPLRYGLIFERFLNLERLEMPDIDIDFDDRRRDRVLRYVQGKYGEDRVAQIITFGTMAARAAIRDVGRALNIPLPDVDRLAKLVPQSVGITLERALEETRELRELYEGEGWARQVIDNARRLEGICRNASTHAAGVVIGAEPLSNIVPLQRSTTGGDGSTAVTMFDMKAISMVGLLKIDFLGLSNLTVIDDTLRLIEARTGQRLDIDSISLDDPATYALLCRADTHGVFQLEGTFAKRILIDMQPRTLEDLAVASALNRPGPIEGGVVDLYTKRRRGEVAVAYPPGLEELLAPMLAETHGTIVYQDQVMKIAQAVAGFSLGEADVLRGAMGKKNHEKMATQQEKFIAGALRSGLDAGTATELFQLMAKFAGYGFNKAHSVAYGLISYQTAYLKANHPLEYMTALLDSRAGDFDKLKQSILDAHAHGLVVHKPDLNRSAARFSVGDPEEGEILFGLQHVKNVGTKVSDQIVAAREAGGEFTSLVDICLRVESRDLNRRVLESLIRCGALDELGGRTALLRQLDSAMDHAAALRRERELGQTSLFADAVDVVGTLVPPLSALEGESRGADESWLAWERDLLGMYLSDHPLRRVAHDLQERVDTAISELGPHLDGLVVQIGGCVRDVRAFVPRRSSSGQRMAFVQLEDLTGSCEVIVFQRVFEECAALLRADAVIVVQGRVEAGRPAVDGTEEDDVDAPPAKILADAVFAVDDARLVAWRRNSSVHVRLGRDQLAMIAPLRQAVAAHPGDCPVVVHVEGLDSIDDIALPGDFGVAPGPGLERVVEGLLGEGSYRVETRRDRAPAREVGAGRRG